MGAAKEVSATASKPQLRNLHHGTIKKNLIVGTVLCAISVVIMQVHNDSKKKDYAEFYK